MLKRYLGSGSLCTDCSGELRGRLGAPFFSDKVHASDMGSEVWRLKMFGERVPGVLNSRDFLDDDVTTAYLPLNPEQAGIEMPHFTDAEASGHAYGGSGIGAGFEVKLYAQILRDAPEAYALGKTFGDAGRLGFARAQRHRALSVGPVADAVAAPEGNSAASAPARRSASRDFGVNAEHQC